MNDLLSVLAKIAAMDDAVAKVARLSASAFSPKNDDKAMAIRHAAEQAESSAGRACIAYVRTLAQPGAVSGPAAKSQGVDDALRAILKINGRDYFDNGVSAIRKIAEAALAHKESK